MDMILSEMIAVPIIARYLIKIHFNIILTYLRSYFYRLEYQIILEFIVYSVWCLLSTHLNLLNVNKHSGI